jgi:DNA-binding transcriptional LysR family regulator
MDRLHLMNVFVAVAEEESFARGARRLAMSPPAVTRTIATLEKRLGVKLLNRTTRYVRVTEAGQRYLDDARRILVEMDAADEAVVGINAAPRGHLAVTAPVMFGRLFVTPGIVDFLQRFPAMNVSALFLDRVVNLLEEGVDVAVRIGDLPDSGMQALHVGQVRRVMCATPAYLKKHGKPQKPSDLQAHTLIAAGSASNLPDWKFVQEGRSIAVKLQPRLSVTTNDAAITAVLSGFGLTRLLSYQVGPYLASGKLVTVLDDFEPAPLPIHVVHREGRGASSRVRSFIDLMKERLRADLTLNPP